MVANLAALLPGRDHALCRQFHLRGARADFLPEARAVGSVPLRSAGAVLLDFDFDRGGQGILAALRQSVLLGKDHARTFAVQSAGWTDDSFRTVGHGGRRVSRETGNMMQAHKAIVGVLILGAA